MKILYAYFSRSGNNELLAKEISSLLDCTVERIDDKSASKTVAGISMMGLKGLFGLNTTISEPKEDPSKFDLVIIGTPAWGGSLPLPTKSYLAKTKGKIKNYAIASFSGQGNNPKMVSQIRSILGSNPVTVLEIKLPETEKPSMDYLADPSYLKKEQAKPISEFVEKIRSLKP